MMLELNTRYTMIIIVHENMMTSFNIIITRKMEYPQNMCVHKLELN